MSVAPMDRINAWLWVGDQRAGMDWPTLEREGITAVFNATPVSDNWPIEVKARVPYLRLNQDDGAPIPMEKLDEFANWFWRQRAAEKILLVHCGAGVSRASTFAILALILEAGWRQGYQADALQRRLEAAETWSRAEAIVRAGREQINPAQALKDSVLEWLTR